MYSKAHKRYRDADIAAMQRYRWNPYKEALLNPISGPLVGVPTAVPIDTYRVRVKASYQGSTTTGSLTVLGNPFAALCSDGVPVGPILPNTDGAGLFASSSAAITSTGTTTQILSNAPFTRAQFAGVSPSIPNVRGRVVAACMRISNISAANTRNGVFTVYTEPQHNTLQGQTAQQLQSVAKVRRYNASTTDWHSTLYHPVDPSEVDGWVWDPAKGPEGGTKSTIGQNPGGTGDGTASDTQPGFMGIWWNGDAGPIQSFLIELYIIAEYVGPLVQTSLKENEATIEDGQEGRHATENMSTFSTSTSQGDGHTGHPHSATRTK